MARQTKKRNTFGIKEGEPLVLPSGTIVHQEHNGTTTLETKEQQEERARIDETLHDPFTTEVETFQRTLAEVDVAAKQFNPVMLVLAYSMWGLEPYAIARYLELPEEQVDAIMDSDLYNKTRKEMLEAIRYAEASSIHGYLTQKARAAALVVASNLSNKKADIAMAAAKDVLDRAGFRPADRVEHSHKFEDELRIVHLREAEEVNIDVGV